MKIKSITVAITYMRHTQDKISIESIEHIVHRTAASFLTDLQNITGKEIDELYIKEDEPVRHQR